jgi:hypothetical protein
MGPDYNKPEYVADTDSVKSSSENLTNISQLREKENLTNISQVREKETEAVSVKNSRMSLLEPLTFISENKSFEVYKKDLKRWS